MGRTIKDAIVVRHRLNVRLHYNDTPLPALISSDETLPFYCPHLTRSHTFFHLELTDFEFLVDRFPVPRRRSSAFRSLSTITTDS